MKTAAPNATLARLRRDATAYPQSAIDVRDRIEEKLVEDQRRCLEADNRRQPLRATHTDHRKVDPGACRLGTRAHRHSKSATREGIERIEGRGGGAGGGYQRGRFSPPSAGEQPRLKMAARFVGLISGHRQFSEFFEPGRPRGEPRWWRWLSLPFSFCGAPGVRTRAGALLHTALTPTHAAASAGIADKMGGRRPRGVPLAAPCANATGIPTLVVIAETSVLSSSRF